MNFYNLGSYIGENLSYNFWMILLLIVPMILGLIVQLALKATYSKYSKVRSETGLTGAAAARAILDGAGTLFTAVMGQALDGQALLLAYRYRGTARTTAGLEAQPALISGQGHAQRGS